MTLERAKQRHRLERKERAEQVAVVAENSVLGDSKMQRPPNAKSKEGDVGDVGDVHGGGAK